MTTFEEIRERGFLVSGDILKKIEIKISNQNGIDSFNASNRWLEKFKTRNTLKWKNCRRK